MSKDERLDYLDDERKKIWTKILILETGLEKKTSDYENEAKLASQNSSEFKIISEQAKDAILKNLEETNFKLDEIRKNYASIEELNTKIKEYAISSNTNNEHIKTTNEAIQSKSISIQNQIAEIEKILSNKPTLDANLVKLAEVFTKGDDYDSKLGTLYKTITDRKKEIDETYYKIFGYTEKNSEGVDIKIDGLKDELQNSYTQIKLKVEESSQELSVLKSSTKSDYENFIKGNGTIFTNNLNSWTEKYSTIEKSITDLLPRALTAGLSSAYSEKKNDEEKESRGFSRTFYIAIFGLVIISLIPLAVSLKSMYDNTSLEEVILRIPRLVLSILPLYVPILWVAYSANRKMNLSKRLMEEYTHKEVLSKTFEGLAKQISNIDDKDISSELRIKLLYNILDVNSENPGKLISDYNKSDHPLMDALDKSIKLTNAVTRLSKIPGFSKLASTLEKKSQEILKKESEKASEGLDIVSNVRK